MIETKYKILEYSEDEITHFEIKFEDNALVKVYYKGEEIKHIQELNITPRKVEIRIQEIGAKNGS